MRLLRLRAQHLRLFDRLDIEPGPGVNLLVGPNGAGKTSVLEAIYLLGYGRSFRAGARDVVVQRGSAELQLFAEIETAAGTHRLGLRRSSRDWEARVDGEPVPSLSELFRHCAVVLFEPGSHALIGGEAELRRRFIDWGLFHVEQDFLPVWRRYQRALKQRNAWLRGAGEQGGAAPWERELDSAGSVLHRMRAGYLQSLTPRVEVLADTLFPAARQLAFEYQPGWRADEQTLAEALAGSRERDRTLGYTTVGPHRANWSLRIPEIPDRHALSRGQEKLAALCCLLAQAAQYAEAMGGWPVLCLDDLASELDRAHQQRLAVWLRAVPAQVLLTGTEAPIGLADAGDCVTFHVEQGQIRRLL